MMMWYLLGPKWFHLEIRVCTKPTFHTRAVRQAKFTKLGRIAPSIKPSVLCYFNCDLTGDALAANTAAEAELDIHVRVKLFL